jgi:hypothetical protein
MVAHTLIRAAYFRPNRCIFESIPPYIVTFLINDMTLVCSFKKRKKEKEEQSLDKIFN